MVPGRNLRKHKYEQDKDADEGGAYDDTNSMLGWMQALRLYLYILSDEEAGHIRLNGIPEVRCYPDYRLPQPLDGQL